MKITKYEHACVVIEDQGKKLVIDPGGFSSSFQASPDVVAVMVTHIHGDHFDLEKLRAIQGLNPSAQFFGPAEVAEAAGDLRMNTAVAGEGVALDPFKLEFYGGQHAIIHPDMPRQQNIGVCVNVGAFYYPGDSFATPECPIEILALPVSAPWLKISESIDFLRALAPKQAIPTHNAILSDAGDGIVDSLIGAECKAAGIEYQPLKPGESLDA